MTTRRTDEPATPPRAPIAEQEPFRVERVVKDLENGSSADQPEDGETADRGDAARNEGRRSS